MTTDRVPSASALKEMTGEYCRIPASASRTASGSLFTSSGIGRNRSVVWTAWAAKILLCARGLKILLLGARLATHAMETSSDTRTILIVDDEESVRILLRRILERAGYTVL